MTYKWKNIDDGRVRASHASRRTVFPWPEICSRCMGTGRIPNGLYNCRGEYVGGTAPCDCAEADQTKDTK